MQFVSPAEEAEALYLFLGL